MFLVFCNHDYYPTGAEDCLEICETLGAAKEAAFRHSHIYYDDGSVGEWDHVEIWTPCSNKRLGLVCTAAREASKEYFGMQQLVRNENGLVWETPELEPAPEPLHGRAGNRKITEEGQSCRKCGTPVVKKIPTTKQKPGQAYRFAWYLSCPECKTMYMIEGAKIFLTQASP